MNQLHLYNKNHMESTQLHHHPKSHGIHNWKEEKKKRAQTYMRSPPINLFSETELHGDGQSQWQQSRQRERERERERERRKESDRKKEKRKKEREVKIQEKKEEEKRKRE